ncbi:hypothetical protein HKBW3S42_00977 [Candidatus Hakubella thermalkaliphila]|uniref:DUF4258 domain-containing protein n=1 Tax=Candidatus Hakubella thermalkaliphila TaxID=2754717 RepID=A0A6V8PQG4_9ACTN|nr:DUF4258 domain-containing protein [Candidatus Hakubella thermalkaliphila]MBT9169680.1 hypothetical protein [Actinomycetota bacterium]GFP27184.1 hypothetical protein HKBW3S33_00598 [Candidatus Hakubella thermalkaliphila]GFP32671.1 hypothetical protein HKBW3S42_00977 [Candidatus Hakubella thermalkaliphila]GFP34487.1 hypothetical protein HKBW3S43_00280 [Candidatus Hakubella thermalkaliphila]
MDRELPIEISPHACEQMVDRGVSEEEVMAAIRRGEAESAQKGRFTYRKNFQFGKVWRGRRYAIKQVAPIVARESDRLVVVTVYAFYF